MYSIIEKPVSFLNALDKYVGDTYSWLAISLTDKLFSKFEFI